MSARAFVAIEATLLAFVVAQLERPRFVPFSNGGAAAGGVIAAWLARDLAASRAGGAERP